MSLLILVVDDEPDVETLFRQQFRRDLRDGRFTMEFAQSGPAALQSITDAAGVSLILILSDINMPGRLTSKRSLASSPRCALSCRAPLWVLLLDKLEFSTPAVTLGTLFFTTTEPLQAATKQRCRL